MRLRLEWNLYDVERYGTLSLAVVSFTLLSSCGGYIFVGFVWCMIVCCSH